MDQNIPYNNMVILVILLPHLASQKAAVCMIGGRMIAIELTNELEKFCTD